ncbi:MAG: hypothetical protein H0W50_06535 [Parachlamydiaceae bacterium]|nr:hypothetical protein [Parachlamydiaceae bacterium]
MLKLEKIAKTRELNILLRARQTFLSVTFLCALGYALLIHFGALLIFKIAPFQVNYQQSLFPPVRVATELPIQRGVYSTNQHLEEQEPIPTYLIAPLPTDPSIPKARMIPIVSKESIAQEIDFITPFFPQEEILEKEILALKNDAKIYELLDFHVSGALVELLELSTLTNKRPQIKTAKNETYRVHFQVQVDQTNGEIFWWEIKESPEGEKLQNYAIEALKSLKFAPKKAPDIVSGEIEIVMAPKAPGVIQ